MNPNLKPRKCSICFNLAYPFDVVDFNKSCEELNGKYLPLSGKPVYYFHCKTCNFAFAPEICGWKQKDFLLHIYNDEYVTVDPDYLEVRPTENAKMLNEIFGSNKMAIKHLDYGGGNGKLSKILESHGWNSTSFDPFNINNTSMAALGKFNLITAFEVFEHVPKVDDLMNKLINLAEDDSLIIFSTLLNDGNIVENNRLNWWYASPRNGHISLFSAESLKRLGEKHQYVFASFNANLHCFLKSIPTWADHLFK
jgi:hypothetical protein